MKSPTQIEDETGIAAAGQSMLMGAEGLAEAVQLSVGRASTCWRPSTGDAVFDSEAAVQVSDDLVAWINEHYVEASAFTPMPEITISDDIVIEGLPSDEQYERAIEMDCRGAALIAASSNNTHLGLRPAQLIDAACEFEHYIRTGETPRETLRSQTMRLAKFIMDNIPGEPSQSDGAIDTALRLLRDAYCQVPPP